MAEVSASDKGSVMVTQSAESLGAAGPLLVNSVFLAGVLHWERGALCRNSCPERLL